MSDLAAVWRELGGRRRDEVARVRVVRRRKGLRRSIVFI